MLAGIDAIGGFVQGGAAGSFAVEASPDSLSKTASTHAGSRALTTSPTTVTASGGTPAYTHAWVRTSGDSRIAVDSPTSASTTFTATLDPDDEATAEFTDTVTDLTGATAEAIVTVNMALVFVDIGP